MDMNGDGKVSLAEFVLFCMNSSTARVSRTGNAVDDRMEM